MIEVAYDYTETDVFGNTYHKLKVTKIDSYAFRQTSTTVGIADSPTSIMIIGADPIPVGTFTPNEFVFASSSSEYLVLPLLYCWKDGGFINVDIRDLPFKIKIPSGIPFVTGSIPTGQFIGMLDTDPVNIASRYIPGSTTANLSARNEQQLAVVYRTQAKLNYVVSPVDTSKNGYITNIYDINIAQKTVPQRFDKVGIPWVVNRDSKYSAANFNVTFAPSKMGPSDISGTHISSLIPFAGYIIGYASATSDKRKRIGNVMGADGCFDIGGESTSANILHDPTL